MRANLERLASRPAEFFDHLVQEAARQVGASCCTAVIQSYDSDRWQLAAFVCEGEIRTAPFADSVPQPGTPFVENIVSWREPCHFRTSDADVADCWPEFIAYHREQGLDSLYLLPLVFGERNLGFLALGFRVHDTIDSALVELLVALGSQLTLALGMKRLAWSGKQAAVLAERNRIGQEIHDGLAQAFTGILMQLGAAEEMTSNTPVVPVMNRIRDIAREGLTEARRSVLALRPDEERQTGGLRVALRQLAERSTVTGRIVSRFEDDAVTTGLPPEHEHALLRIAQEAVINAIQHAQPSQIHIRLSAEGELLQLAVRDDGCGLQAAPELYAQQGFGLTNMRERAEAIGGRWELESAPGAGTTIRVRVPKGRATPSMVPIVKPPAQRSSA
ncbi:GAF domain-containing sensor histidine kinase [bacterium]|nr:MAG: GAF domain-containing sensor histidine kinase [bacterium]